MNITEVSFHISKQKFLLFLKSKYFVVSRMPFRLCIEKRGCYLIWARYKGRRVPKGGFGLLLQPFWSEIEYSSKGRVFKYLVKS